MTENQVFLNNYIMTPKSVADFLIHEKQKGASENTLRRVRCSINSLLDFLPSDKNLTKERLIEWRKNMQESGYVSATILNHVKYINRYLDFSGCSSIRFNRGRAKDITNMTFGYLTAIRPTGTKNRRDIVWLCQCKCGKIIELPATRLLIGNTLSCGCLHKEHFQRTNKYIDNTSLRQSLKEEINSETAVSGYTGVTPKRGKWQAYINYKGKRYSLGCYFDINDAVKARARAKELVIEDAIGLLNFYEEIHKLDPVIPSRDTEHTSELRNTEIKTNETHDFVAKRVDNTSGHTGVSYIKGHWEARICHKGFRYILGVCDTFEAAVAKRKQAEKMLKEDSKLFVTFYSENCKRYAINKNTQKLK